jgi:hypothetical protein
MESRAADARAGFQRILTDAGGYLVLTLTLVKLQLDDSPLSADSPIAIEPPPQSTEFINIPRPSHSMPSRLVVSLHPTQLTSYVLAVAASMYLSVLVSTTRLPFSRAAAHSRRVLLMTALTISIPGPPLLPLSPRAICVIAARVNRPLAIAHISPQTGPLAISSPV